MSREFQKDAEGFVDETRQRLLNLGNQGLREIREDFQEIVHKAEVVGKEMCEDVEIFNRGEMKRRNRKGIKLRRQVARRHQRVWFMKVGILFCLLIHQYLPISMLFRVRAQINFPFRLRPLITCRDSRRLRLDTLLPIAIIIARLFLTTRRI